MNTFITFFKFLFFISSFLLAAPLFCAGSPARRGSPAKAARSFYHKTAPGTMGFFAARPPDNTGFTGKLAGRGVRTVEAHSVKPRVPRDFCSRQRDIVYAEGVIGALERDSIARCVVSR